jgi:hypothetical protein
VDEVMIEAMIDARARAVDARVSPDRLPSY